MLVRLRRAVKAFAREMRYGTAGGPPAGTRYEPPVVREEFAKLQTAGAALQKLLDDYAFETVLDVGCGAGEHAEIFLRHGKKVTAVDYGKSDYFARNPGRVETIIGDFNALELAREFDCVWASHVLEHQPNANAFLRRLAAAAKPGGVIAITVPPMKDEIVGGHVSLWNAGLLMVHLILAGVDCREASVCRYGYNISVLVTKREAKLPEIAYDRGDVDRIAAFLPPGLREGFNGDIWSLNW